MALGGEPDPGRRAEAPLNKRIKQHASVRIPCGGNPHATIPDWFDAKLVGLECRHRTPQSGPYKPVTEPTNPYGGWSVFWGVRDPKGVDQSLLRGFRLGFPGPCAGPEKARDMISPAPEMTSPVFSTPLTEVAWSCQDPRQGAVP